MRRKEELLETYDIKSWQSIHVTHLSYIRNIFIILSITLIGFIVSLIFSESLDSNDISLLLKYNAMAFIIPLGIGIFIAIKESENYRLKYKASRLIRRYKKPEKDEKFKQIEKDCTRLEKQNKILFKIQLWSFFCAIISLIIILFVK